MKIERKKESFQPVTITIESEKELSAWKSIVGSSNTKEPGAGEIALEAYDALSAMVAPLTRSLNE